MKRSIGDTACGSSSLSSLDHCMEGSSVHEGCRVWYMEGSRLPYRLGTLVQLLGVSKSLISDHETGEEIERLNEHIYRADTEYDLPDCAELKCLTYPNVLENLRVRFSLASQDPFKIYTNAGWVLICVNPYSPTDELYTDEICEDYFKQPLNSRPPHPFGIASTAFEHLIKENESQYILVTGESGGGKTECSKHLLRYLTWVTSRNRQLRGRQSLTGGRKAGECRLSSLLLASNPILEFFGNARTLRNTNSSRFGKLYRLYYNDEGDLLTSARLDTYLLAKSRVVNVPKSEENYHVFHALINDIPMEAEGGGGLRPPPPPTVGQMIFGDDHYSFSSPFLGEDSDADNYSDSRFPFHLSRLIEAFNIFNVDMNTQLRIYKALAGILYMGKVTFTQDFQNRVRCQDQKPIDKALELWEMSGQTNRLLSVLTTMKIRETVKTLDVSQAQNLLHSLCKGVYENIFHKIIVKLIQDRLSQHQPYGLSGGGEGGGGGGEAAAGAAAATTTSEDQPCVGVLDLFGFENLENGFEQLCINYANEELHNHFLEKLIGNEIQLLTSENVVDESTLQQFSNFQTNPALLLFTGKPSIFTHLEESSNLHRSDDEFCRMINIYLNDQTSTTSIKKRKIPTGPNTFVVHHYAEPVIYRCEGFVQRNLDYLSQDLRNFLGESEHSFIGSMFERVSTESRSKKSTTISQTFQRQMVALLSTLKRVDCYFIKCIKSNANQKPYTIDIGAIDRQLITGGVSPMLQLMRAGYPCRINYITLHNKFHSLLKSQKTGKSCSVLDNLNPSEFAELVFRFLDVSDDEYKIGISRAFFRFGVYNKIEMCLLSVCESPKTMRLFCENILKYRREWQLYRISAAMTCIARLKDQVIKKRQKIIWKKLAYDVQKYYQNEWLPRKEHRASQVLQNWFLASGIWRVFFLRKCRAIYTLQLWWKDVLLIRDLHHWNHIFEKRRAARVVAAVMTAVHLKLSRNSELIRTAAVIIQKHARGFLIRRALVDRAKLQAHLAAVVVQSLLRRFMRFPPAQRQKFRQICCERQKELSRCATPARASSRGTAGVRSSSPAFGTCRSRRQKTALINNQFERTIEHWELETASNMNPEEKIRRRLSVFVGASATPIVSRSAFRKVISSARPMISTVEDAKPVTPLRMQKRIQRPTSTVMTRAQELDERIIQATTAERARSRTPVRSRSGRPGPQTEVVEHMGESPRTFKVFEAPPTPALTSSKLGPSQRRYSRPSQIESKTEPHSRTPSRHHAPPSREEEYVPNRDPVAHPSSVDMTMSDDGFQSAREVPAQAVKSHSFSATIVKSAQAFVSRITRRSISQVTDQSGQGRPMSQASSSENQDLNGRSRLSLHNIEQAHDKSERYSFANKNASPAWLSNPHTLTETVSEESGYMKLCESKSTDRQQVPIDEPVSRGIATEAIDQELEARIGDGNEDEHDTPSSNNSEANIFSSRHSAGVAPIQTRPHPSRVGRLAHSQMAAARRPGHHHMTATSGGTPAPKSPIHLIDNCLASEDIPSATGLSWSVLSHTTSSLAKSKVYNGSINHLINQHHNRQHPLPTISDSLLQSPGSEYGGDIPFEGDDDGLSVPGEHRSNDIQMMPTPVRKLAVSGPRLERPPPIPETSLPPVEADVSMEECPARARASLRAWRGVSDETPLMRRRETIEDEQPIVARCGSNTPLFGDHVSAASHGFSLSAAMSDIENRPRASYFDRAATPQEKLAIILKHAPSMDFEENPSGNSMILRVRKDAAGIIRLRS